MKKIYISPSIDIIKDVETDVICASPTPDEGRLNDLGIDPEVKESDDFNPENGNGRGEGGFGNRAKGGYTAWGANWDYDEF